MNDSQQWTSAWILVSEGFDALFAADCISHFRRLRMRFQLIGQTAGIQFGRHGEPVQPTTNLSRLLAAGHVPPARLLVLAGDRQSTASLLVDPRVHTIMDAVLEAGGRLISTTALTKDILSIRGRLPASRTDQFLTLGKESAAALIDRALCLPASEPVSSQARDLAPSIVLSPYIRHHPDNLWNGSAKQLTGGDRLSAPFDQTYERLQELRQALARAWKQPPTAVQTA